MRAEVGAGRAHDTERADVETASADYAQRFAGPVGTWMLGVQERSVLALLDRAGPRSVLEVGGGHGQLTASLRRAGHRVVVHGSDLVCHARTRGAADAPPRVVSALWSLPFRNRSFEIVVAVRLLAHVARWRELLAEMGRVASGWLLVDFPVRGSVHRLAPALFAAKRRLEGNTRPYFDYTPQEVERALAELGFRRAVRVGQFALPMVLHRTLRRPGLSRGLERCAERIGLTARVGSPALILTQRAAAPGSAGTKEGA